MSSPKSRSRQRKREPVRSASSAKPARTPVWFWLRGWLWGLSLVAASLFLAWRALAAMDFAYPLLYDTLGIEQTIERYGPANPVRPGFHETTREERERLFAGIGLSIRAGGQGLGALRYRTADGRDRGVLLTAAEIVHLQDVAHLVTRFERVGLGALVLFVTLLLLGRRMGGRGPSARRLVAGAGGLIVSVGVLVLIAGPKRIFYALHEMIFPAGHQWFFYYEESLMSMMMRAPTLFGGIAVIWLAMAIVLGVLLFLLMRRVLSAAAAQ
ncbi:MAG: lipoprotein intramolecular transacylase Lit [Panacagrimonas sp.]